MAKNPPSWLLALVAVAINVIWALCYPISKMVMAQVPPGALTCWRLAGAALLLLPFMRRSDFPAGPTKKEWLILALMGAIGAAGATGLQYAATALTTASNVSLLIGLETVFTVVMAALFLGEPLRRRTWVGLATAFVGVTLISVDPRTLNLFSGHYWQGNVLMLASIGCYAGYTIWGKLLAGRWGASALTVLPFLVASAIVVPGYAWLRPASFWHGLLLPPHVLLIVAIITAGVTAACYLAWNWLARHLSASQLAYSLYVQPIAGAIFSALLLHEPVTPTFVAGAALIVVAMSIGVPGAPPALPSAELADPA
ncbi:MAG TPA: DMT family transporter [Oscillatoriaceae cyanobacterium]